MTPQQPTNPSASWVAPTRVTHLPRRDLVLGVVSVALVAGCRRGSDTAPAEASLGPLVTAEALAARLADVEAGRIAVLYVGPDELFARGRVPGARNLGPVDSDAGRRALSEALSKLPGETEVVLYCGCCPVRSCPNVRPASAALRASGRANARLLDLPTRFTTDWADKGYPVERG